MNNNSGLNRLLLFAGFISCPYFIGIFLLEGFSRSHYDPMRYPVSSLSIGEHGWAQISNFIVTGSLLLLFSLGLKRTLETSVKRIPLNFALIGLGLVGAGICVSDPVYGYPEDLPMKLTQFTLSGHLHDLFSIIVFVNMPIAQYKFWKTYRKEGKNSLAVYSLLSAIALILFFFMAGIGFKQVEGLKEFAGLFQRLCLVIGFSWISIVAISTYRSLK